MVTKKARDLVPGDTIKVPAAMLQKPASQGRFVVSVIGLVDVRMGTCYIRTAGGLIYCGADYKFPIVASELHTDNLMPRFPKKPTHKGRSVD